MNIPENVLEIIGRLNGAGFGAWAVGGCVRDSLMGRIPKDWDICTSARPEQIKAALSGKRFIDVGIRFGTVTVIFGEDSYEVTSLRVDGPYSNSRSPERVEFTDDLAADLSRRDFTVNAMAWSPKDGLTDPFGGGSDIEKRLIRAVGKPELRFREDALRILRGLRFSVDTGFEIEENTAAAMLDCRSLLDNISSERKRNELTAALVRGKIAGPFTRFREVAAQVVPELRYAFDFEQRTPHHCYDVYTHILNAVDNYAGRDPEIKTALLLHDVAKPLCHRYYSGKDHFKGHPAAGAKMAREILRRLKFDNAAAEKITGLIRFHDVRLVGGMSQMLKLMSLAEPLLPGLLEVMRADVLAQSEYKRAQKLELVENGWKNYRIALEEGLCHSLSGLAVKGGDAQALGLRGREIKAALRYCLNGVMNGRVENSPSTLKAWIRDYAKVIRATDE